MSPPGSGAVRPAVLCICDGWGEREELAGNAIALARTPHMDRLRAEAPWTLVAAHGTAVGLPPGQQGNSEVGHLTIGAGRVVLQDLTRIDAAIADGSFYSNPALVAAVDRARDRGAALHCLGLVSPGGVHAHQHHLVALMELCRRRGLDRVYIHAFTDGRDTPPASGRGFLAELLERLTALGTGRLASLIGRYYAMDRDRRWDRIARAYATICGDGGAVATDPLAVMDAHYAQGLTDEFVPPTRLADDAGPLPRLRAGDSVVHLSFRPDRARQLTHALVDQNFDAFPRGPRLDDLEMVTLTSYEADLPVTVAFAKPDVRHTLGEVVAEAGLRQFHVAETEKYAHVTYFINGGREAPLPGEERLLVPSPRV
ncbi:MAG TPA: 2,3-bisphosphoglycerate-independent phosphoglycerate mutase, partial [Candidatus Dormibacteraeota bacterium]|nr:2,3-bisphosphoglycerate-independent phosphoglycerate mutase [Candidatus Dormibacteraeota bacterium]